MIVHKHLMTQEPARKTTNFAQVVQLTRSKSLRFKGEKKVITICFLASLTIPQGLHSNQSVNTNSTLAVAAWACITERGRGDGPRISDITGNGVQTINVSGKHIKCLNLLNKVITIKLSDVLFMHRWDQFDAVS